jgi:hypothetical protein
MNSIYFISFLVLFSYIHSFCRDCCTTAIQLSHQIDTNSKYYKSEISFDWTKEDSYDINIPFVNLAGIGDISPFFVNATFVKYMSNSDVYVNNGITTNEQYDLFYNKNGGLEGTFQGRRFAVEIPEADCILNNNVLRTNINSTFLSANSKKVGEVYKYYFGWFECAGNQKQRIKFSEILISVNNGKLYQISKYLLFIIAALLF